MCKKQRVQLETENGNFIHYMKDEGKNWISFPHIVRIKHVSATKFKTRKEFKYFNLNAAFEMHEKKNILIPQRSFIFNWNEFYFYNKLIDQCKHGKKKYQFVILR